MYLQGQEAKEGKIRKTRWAPLTATTTLRQHGLNLRGGTHLFISRSISACSITPIFLARLNTE